MVESSCHHAIFDDGGLALGYVPPLAAPAAVRRRGVQPAQRGDVRGGGGGHAAHLSGGGTTSAISVFYVLHSALAN